MRIIGIDPGTTKTGLTLITGTPKKPIFKTEMIGYDCESTVMPKFEERMLYIVPEIIRRLDESNPELVIVEYPFGISGNARKLIELFGVIRHHCILKRYRFIAMESTRLKLFATGRGRCEKIDMIIQAYMEFGFALSEDEAESLFVALFGMGFLYPESIEKKFRIDSIDRIKNPKKRTAAKKKLKVKKDEKKISILRDRSVFEKYFPDGTDDQFSTVVKMIEAKKSQIAEAMKFAGKKRTKKNQPIAE